MPKNGYTNVSCQDMETVEGVVCSFMKGDDTVLGLTVHPSQYYGICKMLKGLWWVRVMIRRKHEKRVLFIGGNCFEHVTAINIANVSMVYSTAKDLCKLKAHGILMKNSLFSVVRVLALLSTTFSVKCNILYSV